MMLAIAKIIMARATIKRQSEVMFISHSSLKPCITTILYKF
jgi:hypothetical protein